MIKFGKLFILLITVCLGIMNVRAGQPSVIITSDRMEMLRFKDHNEFTFIGNVQLKSKDITGACEHMWVYAQSEQQSYLFHSLPLWCYGQNFTEKLRPPICFVLPLTGKQNDNSSMSMGQLKLIIATKNVFLQTKDQSSGETKQATSQKAVIYPAEGKMILTDQPVVRCSLQGTFQGEKIIFYKGLERVMIENSSRGSRSQVLLSE